MKKNLKQKGKKENHQKSGTKKNRQVFYDENYIKKAEEMEPIFQEELERLGVDYIDYFLIHNVSGFSDHALKNTDPFKFGVEKKS